MVITGTNLNGALWVMFDVNNATSFTVDSATQITAVVPASSAGSKNVSLRTPGGMVTLNNAFTYFAAPTISAISPASGPATGGNTVLIYGTNFDNVSGVNFGGTPATNFTVNNSNQITATAPAGSAGMVSVAVTTPGGTATLANSFTYLSTAPTISSVSPATGSTAGGTRIAINGTNLTGATAVSFGSVPALYYTVLSSNTIFAYPVPGSAGAVSVSVTTPNGTVTQPNAFTYASPSAPTGGTPYPNMGVVSGGTAVQIRGTNLIGATAVTFGGTAATSFTVDSATQITAIAPARAAGPASIVVTTPHGTVTGSVAFTYVAAPVSAPTINSGSAVTVSTNGGNSVGIFGTNFMGATAVSFGSTPATSFIVTSATMITAIAPPGSVGTANLSVTTPVGTATSNGAISYVAFPLAAVTSAAPNSGPTTGGTSVVITGSGFTGATAVRFGGSTASFTVNSDTQITAVTTAAIVPGSTPIQVTGPGGVASVNNMFTYTIAAIPAPTISGVSPNSGAIAGGTSVTISGANFSGASMVQFGGVNAASFIVDSPTQISAVTPAGSAGAVSVSVTGLGATVTSSGAFTYGTSNQTPAPTISGVAPSSGSTAGGTSVVITGSGFTGATQVAFGLTPAASFIVNSATQITAVTRAGSAGVVDVSVIAPGGSVTSNGAFTFIAAPTISGVAPNAGTTAGGDSIVITGTNFTGASVVTFGTTAATSFNVDSATQITAVSPAASAGVVDITVTTPGGSAVVAGGFVYVMPTPAPTISGVAPSSGSTAGGTSIVITGTNFTGASAVTFGGTAATSFNVDSATQITAVAPAGSAGVVNIAVTTAGGTATSNGAFTYVVPTPAPTISATAPNSGPVAGGTNVVITGTNLTGASAVTFGGTAATSFTVNSATQITAVSPAGTAGAFNVTVTTAGGTVTSINGFTYIATPAPTISSVSPNSGTTLGGASVVITGTNFTGASAVSFGGTAATSFTVNSATQITAVAPAGSAGAASVAVTTAGGTATLANAFTYALPAPTIASVAPNSGTTAGGTSVVITGTNFTGASAVSFGGTAATSFTVNSATQITAVSPAGSAGAVSIAVTTANGTATSANAFTYTLPPAPVAAARSGVAVGFNSQGLAIDLAPSITGLANSIAITTAPAHGTATVAGKVVTYVPTADYYGADSFAYTATGPGGTSAAAQVSLTIAGGAPRVSPQSGSTGDGQKVSIELTRGAAVGPFTAAQIVSISPANAATAQIVSTGSGATMRFFVEATPAARFGGTLSIGYTLSNAFGVSPTGMVTIAVTARPDPARDPAVRALSDAQVQATRRFGSSQISNFMRRNEQLHSGRSRSSQNISINVLDPARERRPEAMMAPGDMDALGLDVRGGDERAAIAGAASPAAGAGSAAADGGADAATPSRVAVWISGAIDIATRDATSFAPKLSATTSGLSGGIDLRLSERSAIGIGGGYGNNVSQFNGNAARMRAISKLVAAYGSTQILDGVFVDAVVGHGELDYKLRRRVSGTDLTATGSRSGKMNLAALSFGVGKQFGKLDWSLYSRLSYIDTQLDGYAETGAGRNNLQHGAMDDSLFSAGLGFRVQQPMATGIGTVTPRLRAEWGREMGKAGVQLVDYADIFSVASRSIHTPRSERMYYQTSLGTMFDLEDDWSIDLEYQLMYSNAVLSSGLKVQITRPF